MVSDGVLLCGRYYTKDGGFIEIGNDSIIIGTDPKKYALNFSKIFVYPGKDNLGVRVY